jgi:hypothetical protein
MEGEVKSTKKARNFTLGGIILIILFFGAIWMKSPSEQLENAAKDPESLRVTYIECGQQGWTSSNYDSTYSKRDNVCYLEILSHNIRGNSIESLPDSLINFSKLKTLNLYGLNIAEEETNRIKSLLPTTQVISIPGSEARVKALQ